MKRHRRDLEVNSTINITNLLDAAFVLLIAFFLIAPTIETGIPVELPQVAGAEALEVEPDQQSYTITIRPKDVESASDQIFVNGLRKTLEEVGDELKKAHSFNPKVSVEVKTDSSATAGTLVQIIGVAHTAGIENFAFPVSPLPPEEGKK